MGKIWWQFFFSRENRDNLCKTSFFLDWTVWWKICSDLAWIVSMGILFFSCFFVWGRIMVSQNPKVGHKFRWINFRISIFGWMILLINLGLMELRHQLENNIVRKVFLGKFETRIKWTPCQPIRNQKIMISDCAIFYFEKLCWTRVFLGL